MKRGLLLGLCLVVIGGCQDQSRRVVVAAGTTLVDGGLIDHLAAAYEDTHPGVELSVVGDASESIFTLAGSGAADVTITHAPELEEAFRAGGRAALSVEVFSSRFVVVGPAGLVEGLAGEKVDEVFSRIASNRSTFVSRADGSGTNLVERRIWSETGVDPAGEPWYVETGQGMGPTLQVASEREAFTLSELGSFLTFSQTVGLVDAGVDPEGLVNPYTAMAVAGSPVIDEARRFVEWLASAEGRAALDEANRVLFGDVVYAPTE